ncbi:MAG: SDR family NAD(P)-dependent oxidoreductase [Candidatus Dormibacteraceae bacterium]
MSSFSSDALPGRRVLVTGATGGIGQAIVRAMAAAGARVAVAGRREAALRDLAGELGASAETVLLDVADAAACRRAVRQVEDAWGGLDVLVNNAGVATSEPFQELTDEAWRAAFAVNVDGAFHLCQAALPGMVERGFGRLIQIASTAALAGQSRIAAYTASKHALLGLTRALAAEYARSGVTSNCVCPHFVAGPLTERTVASIMERTGRDESAARRPLLTPQGRLIEADEVAAACVYLATTEARSINGQALRLDGGWVLA